MSFLEVRDLRLTFGGLEALAGISLDLAEGETLALIGPNGSGKTSLFNCICGLEAPSGGTITLEGRSLLGKAPHVLAGLGIGRTFQNLRLFPSLSVLDNLMVGRHRHFRLGLLGAVLWRRGEEERERRRCQEIGELLGLGLWREHSASECPYGVQKRVEIGRALALEPRLLLLDEPVSGLNREERDMVATLLWGVVDRLKIAALLVEHDLELASRVADRMIALDHGVKIAEGTPGEVQRHPEVARVYGAEA